MYFPGFRLEKEYHFSVNYLRLSTLIFSGKPLVLLLLSPLFVVTYECQTTPCSISTRNFLRENSISNQNVTSLDRPW